MAHNPFDRHQGYTDQPWTAALANGDTADEVFMQLVEQVRGRMLEVGTLTSRELANPSPEVETRVAELAVKLITAHNLSAPQRGAPLLEGDPAALATRMVDEILGWGPLAPYMRDPEVEEIILNDFNQGFVIYAGGRKVPLAGFHSAAYARQFFNRKIELGHGYRITDRDPYQDARLPDGSRLFVQVPPIAGTAIQVTIRRFRPVAADLDALRQLGTITAPMQAFLRAAAQAHLTLVVSGGTGTGKTTFLQALSRSFPPEDRVVTIEDTPELQLHHLPDWSMSYVRHATETIPEIGMGQLVRNALRQRPTRIILGEARGGEMVDILTACNTGHDGTLFTVHANSVRETVDRLVTMYRMGRDLAPDEVRKEIVSAITLIVHLKRTRAGLRYVAGIGEVQRVEGHNIALEEVFRSPGEGQVACFTHNYPKCRARLEARVPDFAFERDVVGREAASEGSA